MADRITPSHFKIADVDVPKELGYDEWKRAKVMQGLEETKDRSKMIPAAEVWKRLGFED